LARLAAGRRLILGVEPTSSAPAARRPRFGAMHRAPRRSRDLRRLGGRSQPGACQPSSPQVATPVVGAGRNVGASLPTREAFEVHGRAAVGPSEPVAVDAAVDEPAVAADLPEGCRPEAHRAGAGMAVGSRNQSLDGMRPPRRWRCRHRTPGPDTGTGHRDRTPGPNTGTERTAAGLSPIGSRAALRAASAGLFAGLCLTARPLAPAPRATVLGSGPTPQCAFDGARARRAGGAQDRDWYRSFDRCGHRPRRVMGVLPGHRSGGRGRCSGRISL
jgi:hypothetical protein